jgi:mono/diheme cytochrome c family protein
MSIRPHLIAAFALLTLATVAAAGDDTAKGQDHDSFRVEVAPFLNRYCIDCHGGKKPKGGLDLGAFDDEEDVAKASKTWEKVLDLVEAGDMPPPDRPQPTELEAERVARWITQRLSKSDCSTGTIDPGRVTLRRLNRSEYNNTIRDLVGIDFKPADDFPSDDVGYGFDNIGDVLSLPPLLMEKYLAAAEAIADRAFITDVRLDIPTRRREAEALTDKSGGVVVGGTVRALYTNGEITLRPENFRDADYLVRVRAYGDQAGSELVRMVIRFDGKDVQTFDVTATEKDPQVYEARVPVKRGRKPIAVAFVNDFFDPDQRDPKRRDRNLYVDWIELQGPLNLDKTLPESHRRIIFQTPAAKENVPECARAILERFAGRAYRRPATPEEVARLVKFVELAVQDGERFERGIQLAVTAALTSPHFLFRVEIDRDPKATHAIGDYELASRLSYFLWSSMPDDELFRLAAQGTLHEPGTLEAQARRMLKDPKARALVENFAGQWLQLRNLKGVSPDPGLFPDFDDALRSAMQRETGLFFQAIVDEDRSLLDFLDADFTFLNERLARHYGIPDVKGDDFRRVALSGDRRGGVLTQASVLTVTSNPTRTSPVKRGKWILEQILGTPPPPPPPDVPELSEAKEAVLSGSLRQRMEQHRANPNCAVCHNRMDALGFGFENYDPVGAWRDNDGAFPIDPSGVLPSGQSFRGPKDLKGILKSKGKDFSRSLTEKLLTYALGRGLEFADRCVVDKITEAVAGDGYRASRLVVEIVKSDPFLKRRGKGDDR